VDRLLELALEAARQAGSVILTYYQRPLSVAHKQDGSPLTLADQAAHQVIVRHLAQSGVTLVSEEGEDLHLDAERYWLVDPLDGTKDFLAGNGEFTVNIALVDQGRPVLGVIFAPAIGDMYWGAEGLGARRVRDGAEMVLFPQAQSPVCRMAVSRFHDHPDVDVFAAQNGIEQRLAIGSALKYGFLAAAETDHVGERFNLGAGDPQTVNRLVELLGGNVVYVPKRPGEPDCTFADIGKITSMLDWQPLISFEQGVALMEADIHRWNDAPLWDPDSIQVATRNWFKYLGPKD